MTRLITIAATVVWTAVAGVTLAQEQKTEAESQAPGTPPAPMMYPFSTTPALDKTFQNTLEVCAACHTEEDMARYEKLIGPMMAMMNPTAWMNPNAYTAMMMPMMDPNAYAQWMNAYMQKYGNYMDPSKMMVPGTSTEPKK